MVGEGQRLLLRWAGPQKLKSIQFTSCLWIVFTSLIPSSSTLYLTLCYFLYLDKIIHLYPFFTYLLASWILQWFFWLTNTSLPTWQKAETKALESQTPGSTEHYCIVAAPFLLQAQQKKSFQRWCQSLTMDVYDDTGVLLTSCPAWRLVTAYPALFWPRRDCTCVPSQREAKMHGPPWCWGLGAFQTPKLGKLSAHKILSGLSQQTLLLFTLMLLWEELLQIGGD